MLAPRRARAPLSGEGAARVGGRWNPPGVPALYTSLDLATAVAEYEQELGIRPGTFCAYEVAVEPVADLRDAATRAALGMAEAALLAPWKRLWLVEGRRPPGWDIAERLIAGGAAGALVPSAQARGGTNLVLWRWNDAPGRRVAALDPQDDLPRDGASWPPPHG